MEHDWLNSAATKKSITITEYRVSNNEFTHTLFLSSLWKEAVINSDQMLADSPALLTKKADFFMKLAMLER